MTHAGALTARTVTVPADAITTLTPPALQAYLYMLASDGQFSQRSAALAVSRSVDSMKRAVSELEGRGFITVDRTTPWAPVYTVSRSLDPAGESEVVEAEVLPTGPIDAPNTPAPTDTPTGPEAPATDPQGGVIDLFGNEESAEKPKRYRRPAPGEYTDEFNAFWSLVTRKQSKADAARLFEEAVEEVGTELVIDRARQYYHLKQLEGTETRYIKSGKNWLRDRLYEDDLTEDLQRAVLKHAQSRGSRFAGLVPSEAAVNDRLVEQYVGPMGPSSFAEIRQAEHNTQFGN